MCSFLTWCRSLNEIANECNAKAVKQMEQKQHLQDLWEQISELKEIYKQLGIRLIAEGEKIKDTGCPPDGFVFKDITAAAERFQYLVKDLEKAAETLTYSWDGNIDDSINGLESFWFDLNNLLEQRSLIEQKTKQAVAILDKALEATLPREESSSQLELFRAKVFSYKGILLSRPMEKETKLLLDQLLEGNHPLMAFFRLAEGTEVSLEEAVVLFQKVDEEFGRFCAVVSARKSIHFPKEAEYKDEKVIPYRRVEQNVISPVSETIEMDNEVDSVDKEIKQRIPGLICKLIRDEKLNHAYYLACYAEQILGESPVPSYLLQALEVANVIQGENGPAARWLSHLFSGNNFFELVGIDPKRKLPLTLIVFAVSLRPSFVAPTIGAKKVLEGLEALPSRVDILCKELLGTFNDLTSIRRGEEGNLIEARILQLDEHEQIHEQQRDIYDIDDFFTTLDLAITELDNLKRDTDPEDDLMSAGLAASKRAVLSLKQLLREQESAPLTMEELEYEEQTKLAKLKLRQPQKPTTGTIEALGKAILELYAKQEDAREDLQSDEIKSRDIRISFNHMLIFENDS